MKTSRAAIILFTCLFLIGLSSASQELCAQVNFTGPELLCRPTDTSVSVNGVANTDLEVYFDYGSTQGLNPHSSTTPTTYAANEPIQAVIDGLIPNTKYFYRMVYRTNGGSWVERDENTFHTQRAPGSTFTFTIINDSHMNGGGGNAAQYELALENVRDDHPDFHFDLGDTFWIDGANITGTVANQRYLAQRQWMGAVSHSAAIFLAVGNHENEEGWNFDDANSKALLSLNARKRYYPNPVSDGFYSGNDDLLPAIGGDQLREDYYAWEWGDALFVVIDPYHYTTENPYAIAGGEDNDEGAGSGDRWDWTLGKQQFDWFKRALEKSNAKFKFVFAHHMLGGLEDFVRGGAAAAHMFEWGGYDLDGTTWGFDRERPGWGGIPVHQLMAANGVSAFFYGHDHLYAYQERDGIVYQEVPSAGLTGSGLQSYYNDPFTLQLLPSPGHLRITVSPSQATVNYVYTNRTLADTYNILPASYLYGDYAPTDCDVDGSDLAEWIADGAPAGRDVTGFAGNFGGSMCP